MLVNLITLQNTLGGSKQQNTVDTQIGTCKNNLYYGTV